MDAPIALYLVQTPNPPHTDRKIPHRQRSDTKQQQRTHTRLLVDIAPWPPPRQGKARQRDVSPIYYPKSGTVLASAGVPRGALVRYHSDGDSLSPPLLILLRRRSPPRCATCPILGGWHEVGGEGGRGGRRAGTARTGTHARAPRTARPRPSLGPHR
ncbi:hypothetical protein BC628DRAFT_1391708 [Trametes gibbosa]|nr:hypothetical protein BC628DRAFT_1391708 [Trametes gibbosa]